MLGRVAHEKKNFFIISGPGNCSAIYTRKIIVTSCPDLLQ